MTLKRTKKILCYMAVLIFSISIGCYISLSYSKEKPKNKLSQEIKDTTNEKTTQNDIFSPDIDIIEYQDKYKNQDIIARLEIPNLFNIILTKTTDNDYYLNHSIDKKNDNKGTEFLDYRTPPTAKQVNVYGHNSQTYDLPFRKLESFLNEDFFNKNEYILLQYNEGRRIYKIFSFKEVKEDYEHMHVDIQKGKQIEHIEKLINNSIYSREIEYNENSNIIVLQTCSYNAKNSYYILSAIEIK